VLGRSSDHEQFLQATLRHADVLHALARRLAPNPADVADIVQETYLRAYTAWGKRRPDDPRAWLATICLNVGRDALRRHARYRAAVDQAPIPDLASPADTADQALERISTDRIEQTLNGLPEAQRIAITLMDVCGFTAKQVAAITDTPRGTVLARVHRGRKLLALSLTGTALDADADAGPASRHRISGAVRDEP
jgi:RNA polymerase sigma-70 factor (ECF subfamily)